MAALVISIYIASESVIVVYFAHALVIYKTSPMRACVLTQKSEEAPASSASLLATPMRVPLPLRGKVMDELERMETMGVISKVDIPTPAWCAGMVVAPIKSVAVRICVDLKPLNQSRLYTQYTVFTLSSWVGFMQKSKRVDT